MDWNKSNTILIIAFIVINIFLLTSVFNNSFSKQYDVMEDIEFVENVESMLKSKNISINTEIPRDVYILPVLETEYDLIVVNNSLVQNYLGKEVDAIEDVYVYSNGKGEKLEIINGKKINYTIREKIDGEIEKDNIEQLVSGFLTEKNIDGTAFSEAHRYISPYGSFIIYTQSHDGYSIDNSYMKFFIDKDGIYKFEMQRISSEKEIKSKIITIPAIEALTRLMSYEEIENKEIVGIVMTYYSFEDDNWQYIRRINSDPTWKVIFSDGSQKHLPSME